MLSVRVLGTVSVSEGEHPLALTRPLERRLLAILVINRGGGVRDDQIIEALWPRDMPANPQAALQSSVSRLRATLGTDTVVRSGGGYALDESLIELDSDAFEAVLAEPTATSESLGAALSTWSADTAYFDHRYDDFALAEVERLRELRVSALERLFRARLEAGEADRLVPDLEVLIKEHPLREPLYEVLMRALYRAGRQAEALRTYRVAADEFAEMGLTPSSRLTQLEEDILLQSPELDTAERARANNIPSRIASLIGREAEIDSITEAVGQHRLVTVVGPGGVGKTTVAFEAGRRLAKDDRQVWWLDLDRVRQPEQLAQHLAARLGSLLQREVPPDSARPALVDLVGRSRMVLVFDNCEHVVEEAARLARQILEHSPHAAVLATSRERLGVVGERVIGLEPLRVPDEVGGPTRLTQAKREYASVALFLERASEVAPSVRVEQEDLPTLLRLVRQLEGLPLSIELAASRMAALSLAEMSAQLAVHYSALGSQRGTEERLSSLSAAVAWSYDLLDADQQERLQRLATTDGPFAREDGACLLGESDTARAAVLLSDLQERSLVRAIQTPTGRRHTVLMSVRGFARERAEHDGRAEAHAAAHARCFHAAATSAEPALDGGPQQLEWLTRVSASRSDFRRAAEYFSGQGDHQAAFEVVSGVSRYWEPYRHHIEGYQLVTGVLDAAGEDLFPGTARAHVLAARMAMSGPLTQEFAMAPVHLEKAGAIAAEIGDRQSAVEATMYECLLTWFSGDRERGVAGLKAVRQRAVDEGRTSARRQAALLAGLMQHTMTEPGTVLPDLDEALELAVDSQDGISEAYARLYRAGVLRDSGRYSESVQEYRESLLISGRYGLPLVQTVAAAGVVVSFLLDGGGDSALEPMRQALALSAVRPANEILLGFGLLLLDPLPRVTREVLETGVAEVFSLAPDERPLAAGRFLLDAYGAAAESHGWSERVRDVRNVVAAD